MSITARILYGTYLDSEKKVMIGGAQNYIRCLIDVLQSEGISCVVYQYSDKGYVEKKDTYTVVGVKGTKKPRDLMKYIEKHDHDYETDLLIFGTDFLITKNRFVRQVAIQHGVAWDITSNEETSDFQNILAIVRSTFRTIKKYRRYKNCATLVCVDYNFVNWYRTQVKHLNCDYYVIPNFTKTPQIVRSEHPNRRSIVFARRLVDYRGTRLFVNALLPLMIQYPDLEVTIAGTGPDEAWMKSNTAGYKNIVYTSFKAEDSIDFHSQFDIAVIPTKGSEGTSLSLLEAMSAECAVIVTNVGGMTNIVLDGYNGLVVNPDEEALKKAIERLINDNDLRKKLSKNARETVVNSFSYEKWCNSWKRVIQDLIRK